MFLLKSQLDSKTRQEIDRISAIASGLRTTAEAGLLTSLAPYLTNRLEQEDSEGNILVCAGQTVPTDGETGFAKGCVFIKENATSGVACKYENKGDETSCLFTIADDVYFKEIALTNAQIKALATTGIEIAPAYGAGVIAEFLGGIIIHDVGTADFATAHNVTVRYKTDGSGTTVSTTVTSPFITGSVADKITTIKPIVTDVALLGMDNQPLVIKASANPITGDGVGRVKAWYRLFETGL
ncbi:MAG: hypothetical protein UR99_C0017G0032 [Candidatus Moranbacteria bacterium GW2011_GWD2_36_12]|nr:MAG: hypothetical protein UR99_C0017G0032 [Candidatus Moranbacteria bacterium GW2011_GWD2_36_12]